jgi:hypothetical protein
MTDLKQRLETGLAGTAASPVPPLRSLRDRIRRRRLRRWSVTAAVVVLVAAAAVTAVPAIGRDRGTRVEVGQQTPPSTSPQTPPSISPSLGWLWFSSPQTTITSSPGPVFVALPDTASATCSTTAMDYPFPPTSPLVTLDPDPTGVLAIWNPGMNAHPCHVQFTRGDAILARRLASVIVDQPAQRMAFCPNGDGKNVSLYFTYKDQARAELIQRALNGCQQLSAPGHAARDGFSDELEQLLTVIAPAAYTPFFSTS